MYVKYVSTFSACYKLQMLAHVFINYYTYSYAVVVRIMKIKMAVFWYVTPCILVPI